LKINKPPSFRLSPLFSGQDARLQLFRGTNIILHYISNKLAFPSDKLVGNDRFQRHFIKLSKQSRYDGIIGGFYAGMSASDSKIHFPTVRFDCQRRFLLVSVYY